MGKTQPKAKTTNAKGTTQRQMPTIEWVFPRVPLGKALAIAKSIKENNGGNPWTPDSIAQSIGLTKTSNAFFYTASASQKFGLTDGGRGSKEIRLTDLGRRHVYAASPDEENQTLIEAFSKAPILKQVYEYYGGWNLPDIKFLNNTLESQFKLDPKTHSEFIDVFLETCEFLNLPKQNNEIAIGSSMSTEMGADSDQTSIVYAPHKGAAAPTCFVIMPFIEKSDDFQPGFFQEVFNSLILPAGSDASFNMKTAKRQGSDVIQATILRELMDADLVLADLTSHNPNVLFELGMRIQEDKPVVLIRAIGTPHIFDVDNMLRVLEYNPNLWPSTIEKDFPALRDHIKATWEDKSNPSYKKILLSR